ncbi:hypothetical protein [Caudoviricetes sp.]|nr:hypothetical protein [Caudoviricetes sp.]
MLPVVYGYEVLETVYPDYNTLHAEITNTDGQAAVSYCSTHDIAAPERIRGIERGRNYWHSYDRQRECSWGVDKDGAPALFVHGRAGNGSAPNNYPIIGACILDADLRNQIFADFGIDVTLSFAIYAAYNYPTLQVRLAHAQNLLTLGSNNHTVTLPTDYYNVTSVHFSDTDDLYMIVVGTGTFASGKAIIIDRYDLSIVDTDLVIADPERLLALDKVLATYDFSASGDETSYTTTVDNITYSTTDYSIVTEPRLVNGKLWFVNCRFTDITLSGSGTVTSSEGEDPPVVVTSVSSSDRSITLDYRISSLDALTGTLSHGSNITALQTIATSSGESDYELNDHIHESGTSTQHFSYFGCARNNFLYRTLLTQVGTGTNDWTWDATNGRITDLVIDSTLSSDVYYSGTTTNKGVDTAEFTEHFENLLPLPSQFYAIPPPETVELYLLPSNRYLLQGSLGPDGYSGLYTYAVYESYGTLCADTGDKLTLSVIAAKDASPGYNQETLLFAIADDDVITLEDTHTQAVTINPDVTVTDPSIPVHSLPLSIASRFAPAVRQWRAETRYKKGAIIPGIERWNFWQGATGPNTYKSRKDVQDSNKWDANPYYYAGSLIHHRDASPTSERPYEYWTVKRAGVTGAEEPDWEQDVTELLDGTDEGGVIWERVGAVFYKEYNAY